MYVKRLDSYYDMYESDRAKYDESLNAQQAIIDQLEMDVEEANSQLEQMKQE